MPSFAYEAVDRRGVKRSGVLDAATQRAATNALESSGLFVVELAPTAISAAPLSFGNRRRAVLELTRALSALLSAGLPLPRALAAARSAVPARIGEMVELIRRDVERGTMLANALAAHPQLFPALYVGVIRAAEKSGDLASGFEELSATLDRQHEIREKLVSLSIYPVLLASLGTAAVVLLVAVVMPRFVSLLDGTGASLPASTSFLLAVSAAFRRFGPFGFGLLLVVAVAALQSIRSGPGRFVVARALLQIPVVGTLRRQALAGRFARLTGVLLANGAPVMAALEDAGSSMTDPVGEQEIARVRALVREGSTLHGALASGTLFPTLLPQLIAVGEESGKLALFCGRAANIFERNAQRSLERLVALLEPAMILLFGGVVAFVALALLQAIYGINAGALR